MSTNKHSGRLGPRLQGAGSRVWGLGRRVLGGAHKRHLTARLLLVVLAQSRASAVLWVFPPRARQVRHIAGKHGVEGAQMSTNKHSGRLGPRLQSAGSRVWGLGRRVLGWAHKRHLTARLLLVVLARAPRRSCLLMPALCDASNPIMVCALSLACATDDRGRHGRPRHPNRVWRH